MDPDYPGILLLGTNYSEIVFRTGETYDPTTFFRIRGLSNSETLGLEFRYQVTRQGGCRVTMTA